MSGVIRPKITKPLPTLATETRVAWLNPGGEPGALGTIDTVRRRKFAKRYGVRFDALSKCRPRFFRRAELQVL